MWNIAPIHPIHLQQINSCTSKNKTWHLEMFHLHDKWVLQTIKLPHMMFTGVEGGLFGPWKLAPAISSDSQTSNYSTSAKRTRYLETFHLHDERVLLCAQRLESGLLLNQALGQSSQPVLKLLLIRRIHWLGNQLSHSNTGRTSTQSSFEREDFIPVTMIRYNVKLADKAHTKCTGIGNNCSHLVNTNKITLFHLSQTG